MFRRGANGHLQKLRLRWRACLVTGFPWFVPARSTDTHIMVHARRMIRRQFGRDHHALLRRLAQMLTAVVWPPAVIAQLWKMRRAEGPGEVPFKRIPGAVWNALRHNIFPGEYLAYALWTPCRRDNIDHYLYSNEAPRLFRVLNRASQPDPINDKLAFHETCNALAIPTPTVLATFSPQGKVTEIDSCWPPARDLFVKPRIGFASAGTERFCWIEGAFESNRGCRIELHELDNYLVARAQDEQQNLLVQPLLYNHLSLGLARGEALATARLVTGLTPDGAVIPIFGFIYFGKPQSITSQHGRVALINIGTGDLMNFRTRHLHSGRGLVLPNWTTVLRYAGVAHRACSRCIFVGWDVAFTEEGPMFLEGNENWSADEYQALAGQPLGHTEFAKVLKAHLDKPRPH
jgi:hypothetical protein